MTGRCPVGSHIESRTAEGDVEIMRVLPGDSAGCNDTPNQERVREQQES